jgi:ABC-2 type transport system ATP-binding protein
VTDEVIIETHDLTKTFDHITVVDGVTFEVPRGKIFGFIGPSGSGKTTTIRMLTGYYAPTRGYAKVFSCPPTTFQRKLRQRIGYLPQLFVLYPNLSIWENLNFIASIYGMGYRRKERLLEALDFVELTEHRGKIARDLSGGMQRRLSLAATLIHDPELIFLDEPTAGVDPVLRRKFWDHFHHLRDQGRTLFITTQYISEASYCDLVGVMIEGKLLVVDTPKGLRYSAYGGDIVMLSLEEPIDSSIETQIRELDFVRGELVREGRSDLRIVVNEASTDVPKLLTWSQEHDLSVASI